MTKFSFRIRTRSGLIVDNLMIHGRDRAEAENKLAQMYRHCQVVAYRIVWNGSGRAGGCTVHRDPTGLRRGF